MKLKCDRSWDCHTMPSTYFQLDFGNWLLESSSTCVVIWQHFCKRDCILTLLREVTFFFGHWSMMCVALQGAGKEGIISDILKRQALVLTLLQSWTALLFLCFGFYKDCHIYCHTYRTFLDSGICVDLKRFAQIRLILANHDRDLFLCWLTLNSWACGQGKSVRHIFVVLGTG